MRLTESLKSVTRSACECDARRWPFFAAIERLRDRCREGIESGLEDAGIDRWIGKSSIAGHRIMNRGEARQEIRIRQTRESKPQMNHFGFIHTFSFCLLEGFFPTLCTSREFEKSV